MATNQQQWDSEGGHRPPLVLVASDDADTSELVARVFVARGRRADTASSVDDALQESGAQLPRCVVADLSSGGIEPTVQLLDGIRHHDEPEVRATRVIVVTRSPGDRDVAFEHGADGLLERPFHADELVALVGELLDPPSGEHEPPSG